MCCAREVCKPASVYSEAVYSSPSAPSQSACAACFRLAVRRRIIAGRLLCSPHLNETRGKRTSEKALPACFCCVVLPNPGEAVCDSLQDLLAEPRGR